MLENKTFITFYKYINMFDNLFILLISIGGGLEDSFWSPWSWPRKFISLALASNLQLLENWPVLGRGLQLFASF